MVSTCDINYFLFKINFDYVGKTGFYADWGVGEPKLTNWMVLLHDNKTYTTGRDLQRPFVCKKKVQEPCLYQETDHQGEFVIMRHDY
jgi:hypothetical protein